MNLEQLLGAAHGLEVAFVFADFQGEMSPPLVFSKNEVARDKLANTMMDYWGNFAHTGAPQKGSTGAQPLWPKWQAEKNLMVLDTGDQLGVRNESLTAAALKAQLKADATVTQEQRCELYEGMFNSRFQANEFYRPSEMGCEPQ